MAKRSKLSKPPFTPRPIYNPRARPQSCDEQLSLDAFISELSTPPMSTQLASTPNTSDTSVKAKVTRRLRRVLDTERPPRPRDLKEARIARDDALSHVEEAMDKEWASRALSVIERLARTQATLHCDDLWEHIEFPREARASGSVWQRAARLGYIRRTTELRPSKHSHGSGKPVWHSLLFGSGD